jgi:hypothetical protein
LVALPALQRRRLHHFGVDTLRPANDLIRFLSILESMVGIALTGLLGFVLGNRIRRS